MEYLLKEQILALTNQRNYLIESLADLNENLPLYINKVSELNNQIMQIDAQIKDYIFTIKDIKMIELQNSHIEKTQRNET